MQNTGDPTSKIVDLGQRLEPSGMRGGEILNAVRAIAARRLQPSMANLFEQVDDALFDLAEKAENNAAQVHYFDGMREVRKRRPMVERTFLAQVSRNIDDVTGKGRAAAAPVEAPPTGPLELSLVADSELEESLAVTSMIGKNEMRLARELYAVNQRLSVICGGLKIDDAGNPLGPAALAQAFRQSVRELSADMRVKLIVYKLFDRYVLSALDELYQEVNAELVRAGVLPQLRHEVQRDGHGAAAASGGKAPAAAATGTRTPAADADRETPAELLQTLSALFQARRARPAAPLSALDHGPLPTAGELIGALSVLQNQAATLQPHAGGVAGSLDLTREVLQLKEQLLAQLGALRGERPGQMASIDEDTIDLVGMLFEFILEDRNLPAQIQVLLARLQIPYLKAAILDRKLFAHRQHPARRLLDGLAEAAKGWSEESDRDGRLLAMVKSIVERLLQEFDDDLGIFERLCTELQRFQDTAARRAELAEQRVAESTRGREKLEQARRHAAREILGRIDGRTLPPLLHDVLTRAWANYLVLTLLRQGENSRDYRDALRFVDDFIGSARPARDAESRQNLRNMLPGIERALRHGLANVAFQESDIERLLAQLHDYYRRQLDDAAPRPASVATTEGPASLPIPDTMLQPLAAPTEERDDYGEDPAASGETGAELEQVKAMRPGTWLEFAMRSDTPERAKLSWISPMSGRYLFVNRRGLKVADHSPQALARALADGRVRVLDSSALFDRAMDAIVDRLRQPASGRPANGA